MDIIAIEGIGKKYKEKLKAAGVDTVEVLLEKGNTPKGRKELAGTTGISPELILKWTYLADLIRIDGVGEEYSDLLQAAGINTVKDLTRLYAKDVFNKIIGINKEKELVRQLPSLKMVEDWIGQSKKLPLVVEIDKAQLEFKPVSKKRPLSIVLISVFGSLFALTLLITTLASENNFLNSLSLSLIIFSPVALLTSFILIFVNRKKDRTRTRAFLAATLGSLAILIFSSVMFSQTYDHILIADKLFEDKRYEEAMAYYQRVIDKGKDQAKIEEARIKIQQSQDYIDQASGYATNGDSYYKDNLYELALEEYNKGYKIYPYLAGIEDKIEDTEKKILDTPKNSPPVAEAGKDISCCVGEEINLSGEGSSDPEGDTLSYNWEIQGQEYEGKSFKINISKAGTYTAVLTVSDGEFTSEDTVVIEVSEAVAEVPEEEESGTWTTKCIRVIDGDTIELESGDRVRYIGIDCPETDDEYGTLATEFNRDLVEGKIVTLEKDVSDTDRYGRILAYVYVGDIFVNAYIVQEGYAQVSTYPPDVKYADYFLELQQEAREENKGLWGLEVAEAEEEVKTTGSIEVTSLTSPVERGSKATISINTNPNAYCTITVYYRSGVSTAQGLDPKYSGSDGKCSWSWTVGSNTTPGDWRIVITSDGAQDKEVYFTVTKTATEIAQEQEPQEEEPTEETPPAEASYGITVTGLTSPVSQGANATISINTAPNTYCTITVYYKSGPSTAQGLEPKNTDSSGNVSWTWKVGTRTTPGDWKIVINVQGIGQIEQYFTVTG